MEEMIVEKRCNRCKLVKPLSEFGRNKNTKDGLLYYCKDCGRKRIKLLMEINKETLKEYHKKYFKEWGEKNKEKRKKYNKERYEKNKEKIKLQQKEYYNRKKERLGKEIDLRKKVLKFGELL